MATTAPQYPFTYASQNVIDYIFEGELNRIPDAAGAASATAFLLGGGTEAQLRLIVATSAEAQAKLAASYQRILGRPADAAGLAGFTQFLATADLDALYTSEVAYNQYGSEGNYPYPYPTIPLLLAHSDEAQAKITAIYQAVLGRAPDASGRLAFTVALGNFGASLESIRISMAGSAEAQKAIGDLYVSVLGRQADQAGQLAQTLFLAKGGSLATMRAAFVGSYEVTYKIQQGYEASGHSVYTQSVAIAAGQSELQSGIPFADLRAELGQLAGGAAPVDPGIGTVAITPQTASVNGSSEIKFISSLLNNGALISGGTAAAVRVAFGGGGTASVTGFDVGSDVLQFQQYQRNAAGSITMAPDAAGTGTLLLPAGGGAVDLLGVSVASVRAANFQFVLPDAGVARL